MCFNTVGRKWAKLELNKEYRVCTHFYFIFNVVFYQSADNLDNQVFKFCYFELFFLNYLSMFDKYI